jgi:hypothetical protein
MYFCQMTVAFVFVEIEINMCIKQILNLSIALRAPIMKQLAIIFPGQLLVKVKESNPDAPLPYIRQLGRL